MAPISKSDRLRRPLYGLLILLAVGLPLRGRWLDLPVTISLSGKIKLPPPWWGRPSVEIWLPQPRIYVNRWGQLFHRDSNGQLERVYDDTSDYRVELDAEGKLLLDLKLSCQPRPDFCTVYIRQSGYLTRYARGVRLSGSRGRLQGELLPVGWPVRREETQARPRTPL